jgi:hypothetical protein
MVKYLGYEFDATLFEDDKLNFENSGDRVAEFDAMVKYFDNNMKALLPQSHPIDKKKMQEWIDSHCVREYRELIRVFSKHIRHVSFEEFLKAGITAVEQFNKEPSKEYILILGVSGDRLNNSALWVTILLYKYLAAKPKDIVLNPFSFLTLMENDKKDITEYNIVYMDDGSYSGRQLSDHFARMFLTDAPLKEGVADTVNITFILCYITNYAYKLLTSWNPQYYPRKYRTRIFYGAIMEPANELLKKDDEFNKLGISFDDNDVVNIHKIPTPLRYVYDKPWIYFDHKFPDHASTAIQIMLGQLPTQEDDEYMIKVFGWHRDEDKECNYDLKCVPFIDCEKGCNWIDGCFDPPYKKQVGGFYNKYMKYKAKYMRLKY